MTSITLHTPRTETVGKVAPTGGHAGVLRGAVGALAMLRGYWRSDLEPYSAK